MRIDALLLLLISCCFTYQSTWSQGENMNWHYGKNVSVNFGQTPLTVNTSQIYTLEGCASVSDANGDLLFYTTGFKIWNKNGVEMPNATGLQGNGPLQPGQTLPAGSGYKSVQIIKHPGNANQYFVVSGDPQELAVKKLYYHVVDMSLNNGLGDVVAGQKNIEIMSNVSEHLSVFSGTDCKSYWLVAPTHNYSNQYYTFKIDAAGFHNTPVINTLPMSFQGYKELFQTKDLHTAIGVSSYHLFTLEFDGINGTLSNFDTVATSLGAGQYFNASPGMSKDKTKFYFGNATLSNLYQVDLNLLPNLIAVKNSMVEVIPPSPMFSTIFHLRAAPVGDKIYMVRSIYTAGSSQYISSLSNASQPAAQVVYTQDALPIFPPNIFSTSYYYTLGTDVVINPPSDSVFHSASDTLLCNLGNYQLSCPNTGASQFEWSTGATTAAINVTQSGTYWVKSSNVCQVVYDTFQVTFINPEVTLPADTNLCAGKSLVIQPVTSNADSYLWNTGATSPTLTVSGPGTYYLEITQQGCKASDTINIEAISSYVTIVQQDTLICNNMPITINATSNLESNFSWNNGTTGPALNPTESGRYIVTAVNRCGNFTDEVTIEVIDCVCSVKVPDAFTPNGDGLNDALMPLVAPGCNMQAFNFRIYNRFGQLIFTSIRPGQGWDGYFKGRPAETGTYMYYLDYKDAYSGNRVQLKGDITLIR
ncbi:MAG: gliding motility-associated C-terminal domain-containing protein [Sphingobacteriales bacterium]|nr:MAG: gliding motility-associated C-terminal domain-containing protein [Sphingobacteriales bacterium]